METCVTQKVSIVLRLVMGEKTSLDVQNRIKQKAHDLFMQFGLRSVSMDDIANNLGISKKTIYLYFKDKDALVDAVIESIIHFNEECCTKDMQIADNAIHEIFLALDFLMEIFRTMNPSLLFDMQKYYPQSFSKFNKHKNDYLFGIIKQNIARGIEEELYRQDLDKDIIARYRVESMLLPLNPEFQKKVKQELITIEEEITLHFLFGMVSLKGYKLATKYQQERFKKEINR